MREKTTSLLSSRGKASAEIAKLFDVFGNPYSRENTDGVINFGISENYDMFSKSAARVTLCPEVVPEEMGYGATAFGSLQLRKLFCSFINGNFSPVKDTEPEQLIVLNGVTVVNHTVAWTLLERGDKILLGQPAYSAFEYDFKAMSGVDLCLVPFEHPHGDLKGPINPFGMEAVAAYEETITRYRLFTDPQIDGDIRILLLCNPHNPLGVCYTPEVLRAYMRLCAKHNLILVSDEIYAKSVFSTSKNSDDKDGKPGFTSVLSIDSEEEGLAHDKVITLYGLSKDFASGGLRVGLLHSTSEEIHRACIGLSMFHWAGNPTQRFAIRLLSDPDWISTFVDDSRESLRSNYLRATDFLRQHSIPFFENGNAGFFLWLDLRSWLPLVELDEQDQSSQSASRTLTSSMRRLTTADQATGDQGANHLTRVQEHSDGWKREAALSALFLNSKLLLATGQSFQSETPGYFRLIFAQEREILDLGLERFIGVLNRLKRA
ncbi:MAG: hypothetical protein M1814_004959 [Vezdaea aestivalis]|nr:MAG: hypothetical protein M1814_004959 [Vezdaea aestivalis]